MSTVFTGWSVYGTKAFCTTSMIGFSCCTTTATRSSFDTGSGSVNVALCSTIIEKRSAWPYPQLHLLVDIPLPLFSSTGGFVWLVAGLEVYTVRVSTPSMVRTPFTECWCCSLRFDFWLSSVSCLFLSALFTFIFSATYLNVIKCFK